MPHARELLAQALLAETRDADHALAWRRALGEPRQRRSDLAANSQNDEIARNLLEVGDERRGRRGHHLFEMIDVAKTIGQRRDARHAAVIRVPDAVAGRRTGRRL